MPANETLVEKSVPILADQLLNMNFVSVDEINKGIRFDDDQCCNEVVTFVVGDFNTQPNSTSYVLMEEKGFVDLRHLLSPERLLAFDNSNVTTTDWYGSPDTMIDYIWLFQNNDTNNRRHSKSLKNPGSRSTNNTNTNTNRNRFHHDNSGGDLKSYNLGKIPIVVSNVYHLSVRTHGNIDKNNTKMSNQQERVEKLPTTQQHSNSSLQFPSLISLSPPVAINEKTYVAEQNHLNTASDHMMIVMDVKWKTTTPSASTRQAPL